MRAGLASRQGIHAPAAFEGDPAADLLQRTEDGQHLGGRHSRVADVHGEKVRRVIARR
jgi:hypothetical protein